MSAKLIQVSWQMSSELTLQDVLKVFLSLYNNLGINPERQSLKFH